MGWGLMAGAAALYLGERIPQIRADFFSRIPLLGNSIVSFTLQGKGTKFPVPPIVMERKIPMTLKMKLKVKVHNKHSIKNKLKNLQGLFYLK
jgi:hypothetical protein